MYAYRLSALVVNLERKNKSCAMEETSEEKVVVVKAEKSHGDYSCSKILFCKYPLHEVVRAIFFKCFGFETSYEPAAPDVKDIDPPQCSSTTQPVPQPCPSSTPEPTASSVSLSSPFLSFLVHIYRFR